MYQMDNRIIDVELNVNCNGKLLKQGRKLQLHKLRASEEDD